MLPGGLAEGILIGLNLIFLVPAFVIGGAALFFTIARLAAVVREGGRERRRLTGYARC